MKKEVIGVQKPRPKKAMSDIRIDRKPTVKPALGPARIPETMVKKEFNLTLGSAANPTLETTAKAVIIEMRAKLLVSNAGKISSVGRI